MTDCRECEWCYVEDVDWSGDKYRVWSCGRADGEMRERGRTRGKQSPPPRCLDYHAPLAEGGRKP